MKPAADSSRTVVSPSCCPSERLSGEPEIGVALGVRLDLDATASLSKRCRRESGETTKSNWERCESLNRARLRIAFEPFEASISVDETESDCLRRSHGAVSCPELAHDVFHVLTRGSRADKQQRSNLGVTLPMADQADNVFLARRQGLDWHGSNRFPPLELFDGLLDYLLIYDHFFILRRLLGLNVGIGLVGYGARLRGGSRNRHHRRRASIGQPLRLVTLRGRIGKRFFDDLPQRLKINEQVLVELDPEPLEAIREHGEALANTGDGFLVVELPAQRLHVIDDVLFRQLREVFERRGCLVLLVLLNHREDLPES